MDTTVFWSWVEMLMDSLLMVKGYHKLKNSQVKIYSSCSVVLGSDSGMGGVSGCEAVETLMWDPS